MVFFRVVQDGFGAFGVAGSGFHFQQDTFSFIPHHKIDFHAGFFMIVVELPAHLGQDVRREVLKDRAFVAIQIALQYIELGAVLQHGDQQAAVNHIHLENVLDGVAVQGEFRL